LQRYYPSGRFNKPKPEKIPRRIKKLPRGYNRRKPDVPRGSNLVFECLGV
jgi:hypothetical protein